MAIFFVLIGSAAFYLLVIQIWKRMERHDNSTSPKARQVRQCLEKQALKHKGNILVDDETLRPEMSFLHDNMNIRGSFCLGKNFATYATFQSGLFPDYDFRFASQRFKAFISRSGIKGLKGDLYSHFGIEGNNPAFVKNLLTEEIQSNLLQFNAATEVKFGTRVGVNSLLLQSNPGQFFVSIHGIKTEDQDYDQLITTAILFYERLKFMRLPMSVVN